MCLGGFCTKGPILFGRSRIHDLIYINPAISSSNKHDDYLTNKILMMSSVALQGIIGQESEHEVGEKTRVTERRLIRKANVAL